MDGYNLKTKPIEMTEDDNSHKQWKCNPKEEDGIKNSKNRFIHASSAPSSSSSSSSITTLINIKTADMSYINNLPLNHQNSLEPISALLDYCRRKFLRPYTFVLSIAGLNTISTEETSKWHIIFSYAQCCIAITFLLTGYYIQYKNSYRDDGLYGTHKYSFFNGDNRMNSTDYNHSKNNSNTLNIRIIFFDYILPYGINFIGYMSAVLGKKCYDHEQQQNLIERTFLSTMQPKRLCQKLWLILLTGFFLFICFYAFHIITATLYVENISKILQMDYNWNMLLFIVIFIQDFLEAIVLINYCIECCLLKQHLLNLSHKLQIHCMTITNWMHEMQELQKLLNILNHHFGIPVCLFLIRYIMNALAAFLFVLNQSEFFLIFNKFIILNIINHLFWLLLTLIPLVLAASLSRACQTIRYVGHKLYMRPFAHTTTSLNDLNTLLIYASTMKMSACLFSIPIYFKHLYFIIITNLFIFLAIGKYFCLYSIN